MKKPPPRDSPPRLNQDVMMSVFEAFSARSSKRTTDDEGFDQETASQLAQFALVCRDWSERAMRVLWRDLSLGLGSADGFYVPRILATLSAQPALGQAVRTLRLVNTLEGSLWQSSMSNEGDVFAAIVRLCPHVDTMVVPSFEVASRENVIDALSQAKQMRSFTVRVYLESARRSSRFGAPSSLKNERCQVWAASLIPYFDWDLETIAGLLAAWPRLESFVVRHIPMEAYHMRPDIVLAPPSRSQVVLPPKTSPITRLELRETFINDCGLFYLIGENRLTELTLMSCQGITSSAITKAGLFQAITSNGATLKKLQIMSPWLPSDGQPRLVVDEALRHCTALESLTVAGWDVSDAMFACIPETCRLTHLGVTDFEALSPSGLLSAFNRCASLKMLKRLCIWQRNGGIAANGARVATGWFGALFEKHRGPLAEALSARNVKVGTGWESRLLSGGDVSYFECSPPSLRRMPILSWTPPASR